MARFFVKSDQISGSEAFIEGTDVHHITKVLRMRPGEKITLVDSEGSEHQAIIDKIESEGVLAKLLCSEVIRREPPVEVVLCQGLPKGDKLELIIQKSVELGVTRVIPVQCERSVVQLSGDKAAKRLERWQRVALEAAKQSRRSNVPEVSTLVTYNDALEAIPEGSMAIIPWEQAQEQGVKRVLQGYSGKGQVWLFIGPEGGFTEREIEKARDKGILPVTLGPRILRTETAGIAVLTMVLYQLGDLGGTEG